MKKQVNKLSIKTDKIVALSQNQAQNVVGAKPIQWPEPTKTCSYIFCPSTIADL